MTNFVIDTLTGLPIGCPVEPQLEMRPQPIILSGTHIRIEPFNIAHHAEPLFKQTYDERNKLYLYMPAGPFDTLKEQVTSQTAMMARADQMLFALICPLTKAVLGHAAYLRIDPSNRSIEVGNILFTPQLKRSIAATEAMFLMAHYVFETLHYRRYEWKCNTLNAPSKRAAERLGFTFEGTFRQALIVKGHNRDTSWYSMLDTEWPTCKRRFETWLNADNFDSTGNQIKNLENC